MPKIWIGNQEEVFGFNYSDDDWFAIPKLRAISSRFLLGAETGDVFILIGDVQEDFKSFICRVNGIPPEKIEVFRPTPVSSPFRLVEDILADTFLFDHLREMVAPGKWRVESFIESPLVVRLSERLGITAGPSDPGRVKQGLIGELNDKHGFKVLAESLGIPTIPGLVAQNETDLKSAICEIARGSPELMLRKAQGGGGLGNISGNRRELLFLLPTFYREGAVLVEPFMDFRSTLGSLVKLGENGCEFGGIDLQTIEEGGWVGFRFPWTEEPFSSEIRTGALKLADRMWARGARGFLNVDWGTTSAIGSRPGLFALEANFRSNGLSFLLDFRDRYFGPGHGNDHIEFHENFPSTRGFHAFPEFLDALRGISLEGESLAILEPGKTRGVLPVIPPGRGKCGLAFFGPDRKFIEDAVMAVKKGLA